MLVQQMFYPSAKCILDAGASAIMPEPSPSCRRIITNVSMQVKWRKRRNGAGKEQNEEVAGWGRAEWLPERVGTVGRDGH